MGRKVILKESELLEMIQKLIKEQEEASEMGEQLWPFGKKAKRRRETKKILKKGKGGDDEKAFDDIDDDEKRKKKYQKNVRGGSINTLLNDLASAKPPAFYDELIIDNKKLSAAPYTDDKGKINYTKVMKDLVMKRY